MNNFLRKYNLWDLTSKAIKKAINHLLNHKQKGCSSSAFPKASALEGSTCRPLKCHFWPPWVHRKCRSLYEMLRPQTEKENLQIDTEPEQDKYDREMMGVGVKGWPGQNSQYRPGWSYRDSPAFAGLLGLNVCPPHPAKIAFMGTEKA